MIVSGANRGYGLAMVEQLVKKLMKGSVVIITARNLEGLKEAEAKLRMQKCHEDLIIKPVLSDLSKTEVRTLDLKHHKNELIPQVFHWFI